MIYSAYALIISDKVRYSPFLSGNVNFVVAVALGFRNFSIRFFRRLSDQVSFCLPSFNLKHFKIESV